MVKFSVLFHHPRAAEATRFENIYNDFLALVERMPHVRRRQVNTILGSPLGETRYYRVLEVYYDDQAQMNASLRSPQGQEAGGELRRLPPGSFEVILAEVYEEMGGSTPANTSVDGS
jgi:uncharacterized protein (TIGR02118 family)